MIVSKLMKRFEFVPPPVREATFMARWDYSGRNLFSANLPWTQHDWNQTLLTKINELTAGIHRHFYSQEPNQVVNRITCSMEAFTILESCPALYYTIAGAIDNDLPDANLFDRYQVFIDRVNLQAEEVYIGTEEQPRLGLIQIDGLPNYADNPPIHGG